jgi:hypothetical protein
MKRGVALMAVVILVLVAAVAVTAPFHVGYYEDWNGILRELRARPHIEVIDGWRNEDTSLEEMGFTIRSPRATVSIFLSQRGVRRARDRADGISLGTDRRVHLPMEGGLTRIMGINGYIRFDSEEWKQRGLPAVRTFGEVMDHFDAIAHSLLAQPPTTEDITAPGDYIHFDRPMARKQARPPEPVEDSTKWLERWQRMLR